MQKLMILNDPAERSNAYTVTGNQKLIRWGATLGSF